ncbi:DUF3054 domain-containing protein [Natrarchaeobius halalkaliphilus]|uniref:DUF3054 domain-containing protein n=1 Tax=Natrarchaeobius halalkaliphilus TaxID=1679091 RepID=A0A3N6NYQ9_9EURY|nr:DUF3054 domain-containing protein [Natrarchaeobius halalkaliphilus]RQG86202.1 DUF3054 domain-containing protein [Natrarchaeobius halalkaliphilus]
MDTLAPTETEGSVVDRETVLVAAVDVALLAALIVVGQRSHGIDPITQPAASLETVAPFVIGWLAVSVLAGLYARGSSMGIVQTTRTVAVVWLAAANVGVLLRASSLFDGSAEWPFPLVITGFGLIVLVGWRIGYAVVTARSGR